MRINHLLMYSLVVKVIFRCVVVIGIITRNVQRLLFPHKNRLSILFFLRDSYSVDCFFPPS